MKGNIKKITFDEFLKHFEEIPEKKEFQTIGKILALHNMEDKAVKHDFYSFLKNSNKKFSILFDDYIERESYGVKDFVDNEISKWFEVELIDTDPDHLLYKKIGQRITNMVCALSVVNQ